MVLAVGTLMPQPVSIKNAVVERVRNDEKVDRSTVLTEISRSVSNDDIFINRSPNASEARPPPWHRAPETLPVDVMGIATRSVLLKGCRECSLAFSAQKAGFFGSVEKREAKRIRERAVFF